MEQRSQPSESERVIVVGRTIRLVSPRLIIGIFVLILGLLLALDNLGLVEADSFFDFWPLVFVAIGAAQLSEGAPRGRWLVGSLWIALGALMTADNLRWIDVDVWELFWPVILMIGGFFLIRRALRPRQPEQSSDSSGVAVCCGVKRKIRDPEFRGGDFTAIMGGAEVDLTEATIAGGEAVIDVFAFWGGIEISVPPHMVVVPEVTAILGGFSDRSFTVDPRPDQRLVIRGLAMMGGVDVKTVAPKEAPPPPPSA